jgi:glycosyltransferase involved in cell wall biosynthesis
MVTAFVWGFARRCGGPRCIWRAGDDDSVRRRGPSAVTKRGAQVRIAQVTPLFESVPPRLYGGTERVVANLTDELVRMGHDVVLFASADARTSATLAPVRDQALRLDPAPRQSELAAHLVQLHEVRRRVAEFDVIHFHTDLVHFPFLEDIAHRTVTTLHGRLDVKDLSEAYHRWRRYPLVSISHAQRRPLPHANWEATVHHGVRGDRYRFSPERRGHLAFLGRISPEKRLDRAIALAISAGKKLKIAAKIDRVDEPYFRREIEHRLDHPLVEFIGEIGDEQKSDFLDGADALLFPVDWPEPFGLVMIEAMACGVPVVAYDCGSVGEIVDDGVTGFIVRDDREAAAAIRRLDQLDRRAVRARFDERFTVSTMARNYVSIYERLIRRNSDLAILAAPPH